MQEDNSDDKNLMMKILHDALPDRTDEQVSPIGLIYAGIRWGYDYRYGDVPKDKNGNSIRGLSLDEPDYLKYLIWLADYLNKLDAEPNEEQKGLCLYVDRMLPEDAMLLLGMNAALYQLSVENMLEFWISENAPIEDYLAYSKEAHEEYVRHNEEYMKTHPEYEEEIEEYNEEAVRQLYQQAKKEYEEQNKYCPDTALTDIGYRVPISKVLKKEPDKDKQIKLLDEFYIAYNDYVDK